MKRKLGILNTQTDEQGRRWHYMFDGQVYWIRKAKDETQTPPSSSSGK